MLNLVPTEDIEQEQLYTYCKIFDIEMVHIPNERKCTAQQGARLKRQGVRSGFPDNFFPYPRGKYHGLFIELKRADKSKSHVQKSQKEWQKLLRSQGYACEICYGADEAIQCLNEYIDIKGGKL